MAGGDAGKGKKGRGGEVGGEGGGRGKEKGERRQEGGGSVTPNTEKNNYETRPTVVTKFWTRLLLSFPSLFNAFPFFARVYLIYMYFFYQIIIH